MPAADQDLQDLTLLREAALAAGEIAMRWFRAPVDSWDKSDGAGPVSEADLAVNDMLKERLLAARPDYGWFSEETTDSEDRLGRRRIFIVDPIDGTRAFLKGDDGFCTAVAVVEDGEVRASAVHMPARDETYLAARGDGATLNNAPIRHSGRQELEGAEMLMWPNQLKSPRWGGRAPKVNLHFHTALIHRICLIGAGRFDGLVTLRDAHEWDVAAGALIAEEAGAHIATSNGDRPVFNSAVGKLPGLVAGAPEVAREVLSRLSHAD